MSLYLSVAKFVKKKYIRQCLFYLIIIFLGSSCENNIEVVKNMGELKDLPMVAANQVEILYSDSGRVKLQITAPEINRYNTSENQYTEFPKGILVEQFDTSFRVAALIKANYAIYYEKQNLWLARSNVVARNLVKNEELNTEELYWDQNKGIIYSQKFTKIVNEDGVFLGEGGFEAKEDLSKWRMKGIKGRVNIKDDLNEE